MEEIEQEITNQPLKPPDQASNGVSNFSDPSKRYIRYKEMLGRGAQKTVYKAFDLKEGREVAWNYIKLYDVMNVDQKELLQAVDGQANKNPTQQRFSSEISVLKTLKHKNIMTMYDSWVDVEDNSYNFITELFTSGTLMQYRKKHKNIEKKVIRKWAWQILQGLVYLHGHEPPIIHRDLKCDNIFVNGSTGQVKIGDLGLATLLKGISQPLSVLGTPEFMAPELYDQKYDEKVDVYSYGMCLLQLVTMKQPYYECTNAAQIYKKVIEKVPPQSLALVDDKELRQFIELCITRSPPLRPSSRHLLKHSFFKEINDCIPDRQSPDLQEVDNRSDDSGVTMPSSSSATDANVGVPSSLDSSSQQQQVAMSTGVSDPADESTNCDGIRNISDSQDLKIHCSRIDQHRVQFELTFGGNKITFPFDLTKDTAESISNEMHEQELDLGNGLEKETVICRMGQELSKFNSIYCTQSKATDFGWFPVSSAREPLVPTRRACDDLVDHRKIKLSRRRTMSSGVMCDANSGYSGSAFDSEADGLARSRSCGRDSTDLGPKQTLSQSVCSGVTGSGVACGLFIDNTGAGQEKTVIEQSSDWMHREQMQTSTFDESDFAKQSGQNNFLQGICVCEESGVSDNYQHVHVHEAVLNIFENGNMSATESISGEMQHDSQRLQNSDVSFSAQTNQRVQQSFLHQVNSFPASLEPLHLQNNYMQRCQSVATSTDSSLVQAVVIPNCQLFTQQLVNGHSKLSDIDEALKLERKQKAAAKANLLVFGSLERLSEEAKSYKNVRSQQK